MTQALAEGAIAGARYDSYLRLRDELEAAHMRRTTGRIARRPLDPRKTTR